MRRLTVTLFVLVLVFPAAAGAGASTDPQVAALKRQVAASRSIFGAQTAVSDFKNCADLANPDVPRVGIQAAPTIAPFLSMMQWLHVTIP
jgi:hypothetical protein